MSKRVVEGSVVLEHSSRKTEELCETEPVEAAKETPVKIKPKEFVDMSGLTNMFRSVLDYQYRAAQAETGQEESMANQEEKDPLAEERNKLFSVAFLTRFVLLGYQGQNKVDITDLQLQMP